MIKVEIVVDNIGGYGGPGATITEHVPTSDTINLDPDQAQSIVNQLVAQALNRMDAALGATNQDKTKEVPS